ncbi:MAG: hypothetical protein K0M69_18255 [Youngiibacter sp.]|nr:hypothetical protein [Youngiibacter sp.]
MNDVRHKLQSYNRLKAMIKSCELDIEELKSEIINAAPTISSERVQSSGISDSTADKAIKIMERTSELEKRRKRLEIEKERIENAITILSPQEEEVIRLRYFERRTWSYIQEKLNYSFSYTRKIERRSLSKLTNYL